MSKNFIRKTFNIDLTQKDLSNEDDKYFNVSGLVAGYNNIDHDNDILVKGIFDDSIQKRLNANRPFPILFNHKSDRPIGIATEFNFDRQDGLASTAKLIKESEFVSKEIIPLVKGGAISEFSVGFLTRESEYDSKTGIRTITKGELIEYSLVVKGANDNALVENFKSFLNEVKTIRDAEDLLRERCELSSSDAKAFIALIKRISNQREVEEKMEREASSVSENDIGTILDDFAINLAINNFNPKIKL